MLYPMLITKTVCYFLGLWIAFYILVIAGISLAAIFLSLPTIGLPSLAAVWATNATFVMLLWHGLDWFITRKNRSRK